MQFSDTIGLLPGFAELANLISSSLPVGILICWAITPGMMIVIAFVFESRLLPLRPSKQFLSFFPGDLCLGVMATGLISSAQSMPSNRKIGPIVVNSVSFQLDIFILVVAVAYSYHFFEARSGLYTARAANSPTKWYHELVIYVGYGYLIAATLVAHIVAGGWGWLDAIPLTAGAIWLILVTTDTVRRNDNRERARHAHVEDWRPFWVH